METKAETTSLRGQPPTRHKGTTISRTEETEATIKEAEAKRWFGCFT